MNDRFKFRIYCKSEDKMMLFNNPTLIDGDIMQGGLLFKNYDHKIKNVHEVAAEDLFLMQCTGLKDKNGNLIYEGDIVKINTSKAKDEIFFIKHEIGSFMIVRNNQILDARYEMFIDDIYPLSQLWINEYQEEFFDCLEVIGNIYENPELLGGEKNEQRLKSIHSK